MVAIMFKIMQSSPNLYNYSRINSSLYTFINTKFKCNQEYSKKCLKKIYIIQGNSPESYHSWLYPPSVKSFLKFNTSKLNLSALTQTPFFCFVPFLRKQYKSYPLHKISFPDHSEEWTHNQIAS